MAKHFYHVPLQNALGFIKTHKSTLARLIDNPKERSYHHQLGKAYYQLQIESFMHFFKIDRDTDYALRTLEYFNSMIFFREIHTALNLSQFGLDPDAPQTREIFYALCHLYATEEPEAFEHFIQKTLLHYHSAFNPESDIHIDHKELSHALAKNRKQTIRESFGEADDDMAYFKLYLDGTLIADERGKRIKTLRKKAYKRLFFRLIEVAS
jgi:hypothetical protein